MVNIYKTVLDGVLLIDPPTVFRDHRGHYIELYNDPLYKAAGVKYDFIQDDIVVSQRNVLRGIHGSPDNAKLVTCLYGIFYLVVVNNIVGSPQFRQWMSITLYSGWPKQVLIPPGFGNGHLVLSDSATFHYRQTTVYNRASQFTLMWNDPDLAIDWPTQDPILSSRDRGEQ